MGARLHEIHDPGPDEQLSPGHIRWWLGHGSGQPDDDAFDLDSLTPCAALGRREELLRPLLPEWFWEGPYGTTALSIGTGRGYFERKHWSRFDHIYVIDPADRTRLWQRYFKVLSPC